MRIASHLFQPLFAGGLLLACKLACLKQSVYLLHAYRNLQAGTGEMDTLRCNACYVTLAVRNVCDSDDMPPWQYAMSVTVTLCYLAVSNVCDSDLQVLSACCKSLQTGRGSTPCL